MVDSHIVKRCQPANHVCLLHLLSPLVENVQRFLLTHDPEPCRSLVANVTIINNSLQDVGKDGKLQLLLCIAVRYVYQIYTCACFF